VSELLTINDSLEIKDNSIDVTAYGEVLIDMISREEAPLRQCQNFTRYFGGSPANVLVNLQRLNNTTAFISRVGRDDFGEYLTGILEEENVNLDCLQLDEQAATPIIFVNKSKETPSWLPYRGADINIEENNSIFYWQFYSF
jgi:fructokinase